jgi:DNA polymerase III subunit chi
VRGTDEVALDRLDTRLWTVPEDSFLPHGRVGDHPVLIGIGAATNRAQGIILVDGAVATADEAKALQRLWVVFDGGDDAAVAGARALWKALTGDGVDAEYWSEESGKWVRTAEKKAEPG